MNPKKKSRRYRASVSIQALDLAISRFTNSLGFNNMVGLLTLTQYCIWLIKMKNFHAKAVRQT
jgi:hypothetical protein